MHDPTNPGPEPNPNADTPAPLPLQPVPMNGSKTIDPILGMSALVLGGGVVLFLAIAGQTATMGATRSTKLKWEQRQQEIEAAQCHADSTTKQSK